MVYDDKVKAQYNGVENYCYYCGKYAILDYGVDKCVYCGAEGDSEHKVVRHTKVKYGYVEDRQG